MPNFAGIRIHDIWNLKGQILQFNYICRRRFSYILYCYQSLTRNVFRDHWTDIILETFMVPCGKFSGKKIR